MWEGEGEAGAEEEGRLEGDPDYSPKFQGEVVVVEAVRVRGPAQGSAVAEEQYSRYYPCYLCWNHSLQEHQQQEEAQVGEPDEDLAVAPARYVLY